MSRHARIMELVAKRICYGYWTCGWNPYKRDRQRRKPLRVGPTFDVEGNRRHWEQFQERLAKRHAT